MNPHPRIELTRFDCDSAIYRASLRLREAVLRAPLGLTLTSDDLELDPRCTHFAALDAGRIVAVLLLLPLDATTVKMRQVAVAPEFRGSGIGKALVLFAEECARREGFRTMIAHARETALGFYLRLGYFAEGDSFLETTVPHRVIRKDLSGDFSSH